jgi:hypothetical protein
MQSINKVRSTLVHNAQLEIPGFAVAQTRGKLLRYEPLETVTDGSSESLSHGFFDIEDAPPWDTCKSSRLYPLVQLVRVVGTRISFPVKQGLSNLPARLTGLGTLPKPDFTGTPKDRYHVLGVEWGFSFVKTSGASCDEIIMANGHRKSLMSLV